MKKNYGKKSDKKLVNTLGSPSLNQGSKFDNYQKEIKKNLEKNNKQFFSEGFNNMDRFDIKENGLTKQTINAVEQNSINYQQQQSLNELRQLYKYRITQYENLMNEINGITTGYLNRVNHNNPYLGKTVGFTGGPQLGYVTSQGVFKYIPSPEILNSINISATVTPLNIPWNDSYTVPGTAIPTTPPLVAGTPVVYGQSFGNEGTNVYVDEFLPPNATPSYMGCYATNSNNNNMTFIGGSPPPPEGSLINGNFIVPQIAANSFQYLSQELAGWDFNAVLINNSTAWGYPMPYPFGPQAACIQGNQFFGQWIQLNAGSYTLSFSACGRPGYSGANTIYVGLWCPSENIIAGITTFTPPLAWQTYTETFNITTSGNYSLSFNGEIPGINNSTAIQGIQLTNTGLATQGTYTYSACQEAAMNGGYQYFALQNVNPATSTGFCGVSNDQPAIIQNGEATTPSKLNPVWSSNTQGQTGNSAVLSVSGSLQVINSSGQAVYSTPNSNAQPSNYLGCYGDNPNRAMALFNNSSQQYDLAQCQELARIQGYTYFGLQNSTSGTNAQCGLSRDWAQTTQYGPAQNCTQIGDGSYSGGGWSNAVYNAFLPQSNYVLIINDNSIIVQRGTSPNDNQGSIWTQSFQAEQPNPQYAASNGLYGKNYITQGQTLAAGDWIGSPNGYAMLIMQSDGNLVIYTFSMQSGCQTMSDGNTGGGVGANATYNFGVSSIPGNIGNLAYIDANSEMHLYPNSNREYSTNYSVYNNTDSPQNDIPGAAFSGTQQQCQTACNENPDCAGYVTDAAGSYCWPKTSSMFPYSQTGVYNTDRNTYVRTMVPIAPPFGVLQNTNNTDTVTYQNYVNGGAISNEYGLAKATSVQKQQLSQLQSQINLLAQRISTLSNQYETGVNVLENQAQKNVTGIGNYLNQLKNTNSNISLTTEMNSGNLKNILSDSDIVVLQKNYSYLVWSILAAGTVLITMNITKK